jgi:hypothetical protein
VLSLIDVVTASSLQAFVPACAAGLRAAADLLSVAYTDVIEAIRSDSVAPLRFRLHGRRLSPPIFVPTMIRGVVAKLPKAGDQ